MSLFLSAVAGQGGAVVPGAPGTLSLAAGTDPADQINLSWSAPSDDGGGTISGYRIKMDGSVIVADTGSTGTTYTKSGLTRVTSYNFNVAAINEAGTGADGNTPSLTTAADLPAAPGTLSLAAGSPATTAINLSWSAPGDTGGASITGYRIKKDGSVLVADTGSSGTTYTASGLTASTSYNFNVAAINSRGTGADGNTPSLTTGAAFAYSTTGSPTTRTHGGYKSLHWTGSGNFVISSGAGNQTFDVFVVAGGGGGGAPGYSGSAGCGGGGAGGARTFTSQTLTDATHTVTVGGGGNGGIGGYGAGTTQWGNGGTNGAGSSFAISGGSTHSSTGGGRANRTGIYIGGGSGSAGGSGGGGGGANSSSGGSGNSGSYSPSEGNDGGENTEGNASEGGGGGGGGGWGGAGGDGDGVAWEGTGGNGGSNGTNNYADGTTSGVGVGQWAGGGGGGAGQGASETGGSSGGAGAGAGLGGIPFGTLGYSADSATANTGSGGGGAQQDYSAGGAGGSGAVVIRWAV